MDLYDRVQSLELIIIDRLVVASLRRRDVAKKEKTITGKRSHKTRPKTVQCAKGAQAVFHKRKGGIKSISGRIQSKAAAVAFASAKKGQRKKKAIDKTERRS